MKETINLTTYGDREIRIVKDLIVAIADAPETTKKTGVHTEIFTRGESDPFLVKETISEISPLL